MKAAVFPGQGAQKLGMGRALYENFPKCKRMMDQADEILGIDLKSIVFGSDAESLTDTSNAQPALFTVGLMYSTMLDEKEYRFDICAGHSLGEYTALVFSRVLSFSDGLELVRKRGLAMKKAADGTGAMAAVIGLDLFEIEQVLEAYPKVQIANINSDQQIVISGEKEQVQVVNQKLKSKATSDKRVKVLPLRVSGPFHSIMMQPAYEEMQSIIQSLTFNPPSIPVVMNVTGKIEKDPERIKTHLVDQIIKPVQWVKTIQTMIAHKVEQIVEVGPGNVLSGLSKKIQGAPETIEADSLL